MENKLQTATLAFLIFLSTLCSAQNRHFLVTQSVTNAQETVHLVLYTTDGAPRVRMVVGCDAEGRSLNICRGAYAGETGIAIPAKDDAAYKGQNVILKFDSDSHEYVYWLQASTVE